MFKLKKYLVWLLLPAFLTCLSCSPPRPSAKLGPGQPYDSRLMPIDRHTRTPFFGPVMQQLNLGPRKEPIRSGIYHRLTPGEYEPTALYR